MRNKNICVHDGKIWEKAQLHLKSAIPNFNSRDITKVIALELLKEML